MSTTMQCIMNLAAQYFIVFTLYKFVKTWNAVNGVEKSSVENIVEQATNTVSFAPMLCILFIGTRMRALSISKGHGAPPPWVQTGMMCCCYAILVQALLVLCVPLLLGEKETEDGDTKQKGGIGWVIAIILTAIRYLAMLVLYGCAMGVCYGVTSMTAEDCIQDKKLAKEIAAGDPIPVSAAMDCTIGLTIQFFAIYLAIQVMKTVYDFIKDLPMFAPGLGLREKYEAIMSCVETAKETVDFAPMLSSSLLGRACGPCNSTQMDPRSGGPSGASTSVTTRCYSRQSSC
jgi:hypothetical protein